MKDANENHFSPEFLYRAVFRMQRSLFANKLFEKADDSIKWNILHILSRKQSRNEPPSQKEIAQELGYSPSTITGVLKDMQKNGLVDKQYDPNDLRRNRIVATEYGLQCIEKYHQTERELDAQMHKGFSEEEKALLSEFYLRICNNLIEMGANRPRFLKNNDRNEK